MPAIVLAMAVAAALFARTASAQGASEPSSTVIPPTRDKVMPEARKQDAPEVGGQESPSGQITIDRIAVIDGDTITVDGREWRLLGFDAPEVAEAKCEGEHRAGLFAKRRLTEVVAAGQRIEVRFSGRVDRNHRAFGDLIIDGGNVREIMLAEGYARPYTGGRIKGWCAPTSRHDLLPEQEPKR